MSTPANNKDTDAALRRLYGKTVIPAHFRTDTGEPREQPVEVYELPISQLMEFGRLASLDPEAMSCDQVGVIALCCKKPREWVDTLTDEGAALLFAEAMRVNFPRLAGRITAQAAVLRDLGLLRPTPSASTSSEAPSPTASPAQA